MKKSLLIFCLFTTSFFFCQKIESQRFSTNKKILNKLLKKNGNAFELIAPGGAVSYIWSYTTTTIQLYSLIDKKKKSCISYPLQNRNLQWMIQEDMLQYKLRNCQVMDGRLLIINIINKQQNNTLIEKEYSIDLDCLVNTTFSSDFYKNFSHDIKQYKLGWE